MEPGPETLRNATQRTSLTHSPMKRSTTATGGHPSPSPAGTSAAKIKKRPSSLAELRDRQRSTKLAKTTTTTGSASISSPSAPGGKHHQPSIASFFSPAAPAAAASQKEPVAMPKAKHSSNNPFRASAAPTQSLAAVPVTVPKAPNQSAQQPLDTDSTHLLESATRPYHPRRTRRDPLALLRSISTDAAGAFLDDSDEDDEVAPDIDHEDPRSTVVPPLMPQFDVSALVKSVASLNVCVQGTQLALGTRESAYRSQAYDDDDDIGDEDDEGDAWGEAAMSSGDEFDDEASDQADHGPSWFDALLDDDVDEQAGALADQQSDLSLTLTKPVVAQEQQSTLDLLLNSDISTHAMALPRRLTFTATNASTSTSLLSTFAPAVHPIADPSLLSSSFSAFFTSSLASDSPATSLVANLHHFRFPPTPLAPAARAVLARTLAASTSWPPMPTPASASALTPDIEWYLVQVDMWQAALRHLTADAPADAPADGFLMIQQLAATGNGPSGFVVAVQGHLNGAYVLNATRGMRRAMMAAGVQGIKAVAGPGLIALREDEEWRVGEGQASTGRRRRRRRKLARQYVVDYDEHDHDHDHDQAASDEQADADRGEARNMDADMDDPHSPSAAATTSQAVDDRVLDPSVSSLLYVPPHATPALLAFLHTFPTAYNLQSAHAPDPELPVLLASQPFVHASVASAKVTRCGYVSSAVHGERAVRVQIDGWVLPWKVKDVVSAVVGGPECAEDGGKVPVEVGVSWEDGCGVVREASGGGGRVGRM
ncbi:hypothetical protein BCR44DRAFT_43749, partial [Catenaria anguillulae PL171]